MLATGGVNVRFQHTRPVDMRSHRVKRWVRWPSSGFRHLSSTRPSLMMRGQLVSEVYVIKNALRNMVWRYALGMKGKKQTVNRKPDDMWIFLIPAFSKPFQLQQRLVLGGPIGRSALYLR